MKKRVMALICATLLVGSMSMTAFATNPSVKAGIVTGIDKVVDKDKNDSAANVIVEVINSDHEHNEEKEYISTEANVKKVLDNLKVEVKTDEKVEVLDVKNVEIEGDKDSVKFPLTITFKVNGIKAGDKVILLHYVSDEKGWEKLDTTTGDGTVTATFNSLSPVAFIKLADTTTTSPSTGEPVSIMLACAVVAIGAMGVVASKKRR